MVSVNAPPLLRCTGGVVKSATVQVSEVAVIIRSNKEDRYEEGRRLEDS